MPREIERGLRAGSFRNLTRPIKVGEFTDLRNETLAFGARGRERPGGDG